jgi:hypothetical protein
MSVTPTTYCDDKEMNQQLTGSFQIQPFSIKTQSLLHVSA